MDQVDRELGRTQAGRWAKGHSGNPRGRPRGRRNRATLLLERLVDGEDRATLQAMVERALAGDRAAARLLSRLGRRLACEADTGR